MVVTDGCDTSGNSLSLSAADNGTIHMWDWRTGYNFQRIHAAVQPGSLDSESGIFACMFDISQTKLITAEADKTIKVYREDPTAVSHTAQMCSLCTVSGGPGRSLTTMFSLVLADGGKPPSQLEAGDSQKKEILISVFCFVLFFCLTLSQLLFGFCRFP